MFEESTFLQGLAEICSEAASLILEPAAHPSDPDVDPIPQWADERHVWVERRRTDEPMDWVAETTSTYLLVADLESSAGFGSDAGRLDRITTVTIRA